MEIADELVKMQVDSGASCNVLPRKFLPRDSKIEKFDMKLTTYSKANLKLLGVAKVSLRNPKNRKKYRVEFAVIDEDYTPLLGSSAAQQMRLITVQKENILQVSESVAQDNYQELDMKKITTSYHDVFTGLGCMEGTLHLEVDKSVLPSIMPPRRVPLTLKDRLKEELTRLERVNVIKREEEPTDWMSSLVVTEKPNGKLRVCIDPQHLNTALKRSHYPLPVIEDILPELADVKVFSKADLKDGFLQIQLDEDSSKLTTFQTPWGRYRYLRMPFGISPAPECFQRKLDQNLEGLEGIYKVADDILITGRGASKEEAVRNHDANLEKLLERCRMRNLKLNREKLQLKCSETTFIGHVLTSEGVKPDPSKVEAILKMERPGDVAAVRRLVGLTNYLSKFLSQLSELCEPLRRLTHKGVEWSWSAEQEKAFENVKKAVTSAPVLRYFNSSEPVEGQGDASANGIGFVLMQNGQPVSYSSRALTTCERNYSQIEKELLAQVFGVERNHQYVYGRKIVLWSDHKPLETICKKPLATAPKRLQRLLLRLQQYDVEIRYKPGPGMYLADTLSRAYLPTTTRSPAEEETERIHAVDFLPISETQLAEIQRETAVDSVLQCLIQVILKGWPDQKEALPSELHPYYMVRDELTAQDGILFKGLRCIIPVSLRPKIRERLHGAHTGVEGCLRRARETVYWPSMNADLRDYIAKCDVYSTYQNDQQKESLISQARRAPGPPQSATTQNRRLRGYQRYFVKFKMAQLIVNVHELVQNYINTADDRSLAIEISDELLQLTKAVIKKHSLPGEKAFKYHLSQAARMLSWTVVHWHKIILRRMKKKTSASRPWTVTFTWNLPQEMFESLKCFVLCEENGGAVVKNTRCVAELQIIHSHKFCHLFTSLANKYKPSLPTADVPVRKEKDGSYSTIIVEADHPAHFHYSKTLEKITFKARYGHFNRNGIPQHTLF